MTKSSLPPSRYKNLVSLITLLVIYFIGYSSPSISRENTTSNAKALWQLISEIESQMPISTHGIKSVIGVDLEEVKRDERFIFYSGGGLALDQGLSITTINLMLNPSQTFDEESALSVELGGGCITLSDLQGWYRDLSLAQVPRGQSLQEVAVWSTKRPWGVLSFGFRQDTPACLFRVSFGTNA